MLLLRVQSRFMENVPSLEVEVAYALPNEQFLGRVTVPVGSTVHAAIRASGVLIRQRPSNNILPQRRLRALEKERKRKSG